jgi:hypothetical protein
VKRYDFQEPWSMSVGMKKTLKPKIEYSVCIYINTKWREDGCLLDFGEIVAGDFYPTLQQATDDLIRLLPTVPTATLFEVFEWTYTKEWNSYLRKYEIDEDARAIASGAPDEVEAVLQKLAIS